MRTALCFGSLGRRGLEAVALVSPREDEEETRCPRRWSRVSPWVSVAAGLQAHVCGCCFVLYNKLPEVHEVADGGERSASQGPAGERRPGGHGPGGRERRRAHAGGRPLLTPEPRTLADFIMESPACPKEDTNNSCF